MCNHYRIHALCLSFCSVHSFAPVKQNVHTTWSVHAILLRDVYSPLAIYRVCCSLSLFIVTNEFEIQTRIQNALLLLESGACAVVTRFWMIFD